MADEVDSILAAWYSERPDLDVTPMAVLSRVSRLADVLAARRAEVFTRHQLQSFEFDVLAALRRAGDPYELTPGQLVAATHVTSGTMTNRVDKLVDKKWVRRRADGEDGRVVRVRLTAVGRRRVDATLVDLLGAERELLAVLAPASQTRLAAALRTLTTAAEAAGTAT
ncbi:MarR family winged helix-turn-helix transcriptional regulator [Jatrophihabitans sp. YIM 134969]